MVSLPEKELLNATFGHAAAGLFSVVLFCPLFSYFGLPYFMAILGVPILLGTVMEIAQKLKWYEHDDTTLKQSLGDIAEYTLGGVVGTGMIGWAIYI